MLKVLLGLQVIFNAFVFYLLVQLAGAVIDLRKELADRPSIRNPTHTPAEQER